MSARARLTIAVLLLSATATYSSSSTWKTFRSSNGFSIAYPSTWILLGPEPDRLDLTSSRHESRKAVTLKEGEACIFVVKESQLPARTLSQLIESYSQGASKRSRREIPEQQRGSCSQLEEVVWKERPPALPGTPAYLRTYLVSTGQFCRIGNRDITVMLRNREGDPRQRQYQRVALRMARSIRVAR